MQLQRWLPNYQPSSSTIWFKSLAQPPSAVELRAFLYNCDGFNSLFTGYGYTAEVYGGPLAREYWVENVREEELVGSEAPEFYVS